MHLKLRKLALNACGALVGRAETTNKFSPVFPRSEAPTGNIWIDIYIQHIHKYTVHTCLGESWENLESICGEPWNPYLLKCISCIRQITLGRGRYTITQSKPQKHTITQLHNYQFTQQQQLSQRDAHVARLIFSLAAYSMNTRTMLLIDTTC